MVDLSVVVPVYNGASHLRKFAQGLVSVLEKLPLKTMGRWELIFVDDGSTDGTFEVIKSLHGVNERIRGGRLGANLGQQSAVFAGLQLSRGRYTVTMDDDGQHPSEKLEEMLGLMETGMSLVYMVNRDPGRPTILRWGTALTDLFFCLFCGKPAGLEIGSYRMISRELLERLPDPKGSFVYVSAHILRSMTPRERREKLISRRYDRPGRREETSRPSRFTLLKRAGVFARLFLYYGPFRALAPRKGTPYMLEEIL